MTASFVSGFGQFHSDRAGVNPRPYVTLNWQQFGDMLSNPPSVAKEAAQWVIFSELATRVADEQRSEGRFHALWCDIDDALGRTIVETAQLACGAVGGAQLVCYASRSATEENQKARIVIPLAGLLVGDDFELMQKVLNDRLETAGLIPDRATERANQVMYLPNRGALYDQTQLKGARLDACAVFAADLDAERQRLQAEEQRQQEAREQSRLKAAERMASGGTSPVDAFNAAYDLELMLATFGYRKRGNRYLSPLSTSGVAGVTIKDGIRWVSTHGSDVSTGIGKVSGSQCSGDVFDLFVFFEHRGDYRAAVKAAGEMFTTADGVTITQANQRAHMQAQEATVAPVDLAGFGGMATPSPVKEPMPANEDVFDLSQFALNGQSAQLEAKMLEDTFVLGRLAILGQATAFYAKPNSGKTLLVLWLLIRAIEAEEVKPKDVFYINADDNFRGLVTKLKLAERYGFNQLAPDFNGFKSDMFLRYLQKMIEDGTASGKVVILDTLKKFTDVMDKTIATAFGKVMRAFVSNGGTVIMLAHTNKHRGSDDKLVVSGTSDIVDDADCAYTLDVIESDALNNVKTVIFENIKARGDVADSATYTYSTQKGQGFGYEELLASVQEVTQAEAEEARKREQAEELVRKNADIIDAVSEAIGEGVTLKTDLIDAAAERSGISKAKVARALRDHTGTNYAAGNRWSVGKGDKNAQPYSLLMSFSAPPRHATGW